LHFNPRFGDGRNKCLLVNDVKTQPGERCAQVACLVEDGCNLFVGKIEEEPFQQPGCRLVLIEPFANQGISPILSQVFGDGNPLGSEASWTFPTANAGSFTDNTYADFSAGTPSGTYISENQDGEVMLGGSQESDPITLTVPYWIRLPLVIR
jgi:hypothetical protein